MVEHIVLFDYSNNIKNEEKNEYFNYLHNSVLTLKEISGVVDITFSKNLTKESDLVFKVVFENLNYLELFQSDPLHLKHKEKCKNIVTNRRVIDFDI